MGFACVSSGFHKPWKLASYLHESVPWKFRARMWAVDRKQRIYLKWPKELGQVAIFIEFDGIIISVSSLHVKNIVLNI